MDQQRATRRQAGFAANCADCAAGRRLGPALRAGRWGLSAEQAPWGDAAVGASTYGGSWSATCRRPDAGPAPQRAGPVRSKDVGPLVGKPSRDGCGNAERGWGGGSGCRDARLPPGGGRGPGSPGRGDRARVLSFVQRDADLRGPGSRGMRPPAVPRGRAAAVWTMSVQQEGRRFPSSASDRRENTVPTVGGGDRSARRRLCCAPPPASLLPKKKTKPCVILVTDIA